MSKKILFLIALSLCIQGHTQIQWPAITKTTKPWARWWWQGSAVDKQNLTAAMSQYQQAGLGGLEITPIYGVKGYEDQFINFLSPKWMEMLSYTLSEAKRLNLGIDLANATGWPFGGPWVTPTDACKNINVKTYTLKEGERLNERIAFVQQPLIRTENRETVDIKTLSYPIAANKNLQKYAIDQVRFELPLHLNTLMAYNDKGEVLELTDKVDAEGKLNWTATAGNWKLPALFIGWHGKMVERAAPGGEGDVIDHFSKGSLQHYLNRFDQAFKGRDISGVRSFFNDSYEVDDARGQSNWTPDFFNQFQQRRGYDLRKYLPALFARDTTDISRRVLVDYRQTISDLLLDNFTKPWHQWAENRHKIVRNQSHGSPANILDLYAAVDIPETEGADILRFKFATSAAHVMGKPLASSESATWLNEHFQSSLGDVKQAIDKYFVGGVNHIFYHGTNYSPQNATWPGWLFYAAVHFTPANSFWKDFGTLNNYVTRCQSFLQQGKPDNDVLLYFPFNDRLAEPGKDMLHHFDGMEGFDNTAFKSTAEWLLKKGYAFDLVSDKQVLQVKGNGRQLLTGGVAYKTIVLSDVKWIPLETFNQLVQLAGQGATIIFQKHLPSDVPGLTNLEKRKNELQSALHSLSFTKLANTSVQQAIIGKGRFLAGDEIDELLDIAQLRRETMADRGLQYTRRSYRNGHCYFITNTGKINIKEWMPLQVMDRNVVWFNPMTGSDGLAKARTTREGNTEVLLALQPGESCVLQTGNTVVKGCAYPYYELTNEKQVVTGEWKIEFIKGGPALPVVSTTATLGSWTDLPVDGVKQFSGTAQYSIHFAKPSFKAAMYQLDLGSVQETAEVIVNGKKLGTFIGPDYQVNIAASLLRADNELVVIVTNGMANRIADLDKRGVAWKKFYNTNFPAGEKGNRGEDGLFTASHWQPKASGLIGPVVIRGLQLLK